MKIRKKCEHGKLRHVCVDCGGAGICKHRKYKQDCKECEGDAICLHNISKRFCASCGKGFCKHGKMTRKCKECGGPICKHGRNRRICVKCMGSSICEHKRIRYSCKDCGDRRRRCKHGRIAHFCRECSGFSVIALRLKSSGKQRAKRLNLPFELSVDWFSERLKLGCPIFKRPFEIGSTAQNDWSATLDKFNPKLGYTLENSFLISSLANRIKTNVVSSEYVFKVAEWMRAIENGNSQKAGGRKYPLGTETEEHILESDVLVSMS